jgi:hypothetical protein
MLSMRDQASAAFGIALSVIAMTAFGALIAFLLV